MRWRRLSVRTRLTLWYVALLAGTLAGLIALGLWLVQHQLYANADQLLRSKAAAVATEIDVSSKGKLSFDTEDVPDGQTPPIVVGLDSVRVLALDGRTVYSYSPGIELPEIKAPAFDAVVAGQERLTTVQARDGGVYRVLAQALLEKERTVGVIQVGRSQADVDALLAQMWQFGLLGMAIGMVVAWAGGSFLASRALRPVDRIRRAAEQIGAHDLSMRLDPPEAEDELGKLVAAFNNMIGRLDEAFQRQQRFTADASHELRTPLTVIRSLAEVALASPREDAYDRRVYASICDESERLGGLVESLLVLARADQGQELAVKAVELDDILIAAGERVMPPAGRASVSLTIVPGGGGQVLGDAGLLTQLLVNLLENALRHTPAGGQIVLSAEASAGGAILRVTDSGVGIAPEHLPHLFERFYRVDEARSRGTGGFGLGLAICQWIVGAHRGTITVSSTPGTGTIVEVRLPRIAPRPGDLTPGPSPARRGEIGRTVPPLPVRERGGDTPAKLPSPLEGEGLGVRATKSNAGCATPAVLTARPPRADAS